MNRAVLIIFLSVLAGCASGPDKQSALDADETSVTTQNAVTLPVARLEPIESAAAPQPAVPSAQTGQLPPLAAIPDNSLHAAPIAVAEPIQPFGAGDGTASDSPWDDLTRRVTAWANPLRRSMEPYCQDGLVRKP